MLAACGVLYVLNGFLIGWANAYDVMLGITSPTGVRPQWCAWPLSLIGWAAIPAIVGATAGYVITEQIQAHHARELSDVLSELRRLAAPLQPATGLRRRLVITLHDVYKQGSGAVKTAVLAFGARHPLNDAAPDAEPDWDQAEQHFTRLIETIMGAAVPPGDSGRSHRAPGRERGHPLPSVGQQPAWLPLSHLCQAAGPRCEPPAYPGGDVTYDERAEHAARLRGLLYLACPDAPAWAIESTAEAITQLAEETPGEPVPEAAHLSLPQQQPSDVDRLNLTEANLTEANLTGVDLTPADLSDADLTRARLRYADLADADLRTTNLSRADLIGAKLTVANLGRADLTLANLTGAKLIRADLTDTNMHGADLTRADLSDANLPRVNLAGADLTGADLTGADLTGAMFTGATNMRLPQGAIWNRETLWPANLASDVAEYSDEVSPGIYQVRGGGRSPDRDTIRV